MKVRGISDIKDYIERYDKEKNVNQLSLINFVK